MALDKSVGFRTRSEDVDALHSAWKNNNWEILKQSRGVFCAVHYNALDRSLTFIGDKLCIRPLYYWLSDDYVVFASALRILEKVPMVQKVMDLQGVTEMITLGFPLGIRTPYVNISLLKAAEIVGISGTRISRSQYFRWDTIPTSNLPEQDLLDNLYRRFDSSIGNRLGSDTATLAFLSGGLDSRCVVTALRDRNIKVYSFNFSDPGTQDRVFAKAFSESVGTIHTEAPLDVEPEMSKMISTAWPDLQQRLDASVERPGLVWSGDGGSVGVGHVYLNRKLVNLLRQKNVNEAIHSFLQQQGATLIKGLYKRPILPSLSSIPAEGIRQELDDIECEDPGRRFHIFLMLNDQRRHLSKHFEEIDLNRIEFQLPFFDSYFLKPIFSFPLDFCLRHHLYLRWLARFPEVVMSVPWQAYPGHEAPPFPVGAELRDQWDTDYFRERSRIQKHDLLQDAAALLTSKNFPHDLLSKQNLRLATWIYRIGLRDYAYLIKAARVMTKYWIICDGKHSLS
ncbi:MAG: hypothetical protein JRL30_25520 [Deltaproteobacteria bacterium]|nr:hypothetical protein [Deltaproteobacteria bacterium]